MRSIIAAIVGTVLITAMGILAARKIGLEKTYKSSPLWTEVEAGTHSFFTPNSTCLIPQKAAHIYLPLRRTKDGSWLAWREASFMLEGQARELRSQTLEQLTAYIPAIQNCNVASVFSQAAGRTVILDVLEMRPDAYDELEVSLKILVPNLKRVEAPNPSAAPSESTEVATTPTVTTPTLIVISPYKRVLDEFRRVQPTWALGTSDDQVYRSVSLADVWLEPVDNIKSVLVVVPDEGGQMPQPDSRWFVEMKRRGIPFFIRPASAPNSVAWLKKLREDFPKSIWGDAN